MRGRAALVLIPVGAAVVPLSRHARALEEPLEDELAALSANVAQQGFGHTSVAASARSSPM